MKKILILILSLVCFNLVACSKETTETYYSSDGGIKVSGKGFFNSQFTVDSKGAGKHNKATIHYYNNTSEPTFFYLNDENAEDIKPWEEAIRIEPWKGKSVEIDVKEGETIYIEIRGYDNSNQVLDGNLYFKSYK